MKINLYIWQKYLLFFILGALVGWGITAYSYMPKNNALDGITCPDGNDPDKNGCCAGEVYTDMGDLGFNCCPEDGSDCFPPIR